MLKSIHAIEAEDGAVPDMKETALAWADFVAKHIPEEQGKKLRALIEAVAFSTRMIIEAFEDKGANINSFCASGGIALKDEMMMQIYADVLGKEIRVSSAKQVGAYGSAIRAAVSAGIYKDIFEASAALCKPIAATYYPNPDNKEPYDRLYEEYKTLHDYFGRGQNNVMKRLKKISKG